MAKIVAGMASSHAFTFLDPAKWDERRGWGRDRYRQRVGKEAPVLPEIEQESAEDNATRYGRIRGGLDTLRAKLEELKPDAVVVIGDDQDENYQEGLLPQFAIYLGDHVECIDRFTKARSSYRCEPGLAETLLNQSIEADFDVAFSKRYPNDELLSHAHQQVMNFHDPEGQFPVVPVFVNAFHVPAPSPSRCYQFGQTLRRIIDSMPDDKRVVLYASGGLSHFVPSYPWHLLEAPFTLGSISVDFDRRAVNLMVQGRGSELSALSSKDLLNNGDIEMRAWIILQGALGSQKPDWIVYEPFYRAVMGMAVGYWPMENGHGAS